MSMPLVLFFLLLLFHRLAVVESLNGFPRISTSDAHPPLKEFTQNLFVRVLPLGVRWGEEGVLIGK